MPGVILPPPLSPSAMPILQSPANQSSTLHCALMSWYMAGFHTGYHQAVTDMKSDKIANGKKSTVTFSPNVCQSDISTPHNMSRSTKKPSPV